MYYAFFMAKVVTMIFAVDVNTITFIIVVWIFLLPPFSPASIVLIIIIILDCLVVLNNCTQYLLVK